MEIAKQIPILFLVGKNRLISINLYLLKRLCDYISLKLIHTFDDQKLQDG
jgi:hypothetical protein